MVLQLDGDLKIENLRSYPEQTVEKLRELLVGGAQAQLDPRRKDFYEVENGSHVFYIHISPVNNKVMLLASWLKDNAAATGPGKSQAAA